MKRVCTLCVALLLLCLSACATDVSITTTEQSLLGVGTNSTEPPHETTPTSLATTNNLKEDLSMVIQNKLIVNGYNLPEASHMSFTPDGVMVPFVAVLERLGAEIQYENNYIVKIVFADNQYTLDTSTATLTKEGNQTNYLIPAPGSSVHHQTVDGVFVIDDITTRTVLMVMGIMVNIEVDYKNNTVIINS